MSFTRYYWSDQYPLGGSTANSRLGGAWRSNFDAGLFFLGSGSNPFTVWLTKADGEQFFFDSWSDSNGVHYQQRGQGSNQGWMAGPPHETLKYVNSTWVFTDDTDTQYVFDNVLGQLQSITYRNGYAQTLTWSNGLNTGVTDNIGRSLTFGYDSNGLMTSLTTADGQVFNYGYLNVRPPAAGSDAAAATNSSWSTMEFALQSVTYPGVGSSHPTMSYQYTDSRYAFALTGKTNEAGVQISNWTYDASGRVSQNSLAGGVDTYGFSYDTANSKTTVTNPLGKQTVYMYSNSSPGPSVLTQVTGVASTNCAASNTTYSYDSNNLVNQKTDAEGRITAYVNTFDANYHLTTTTATLGSGKPEATTTTTTWHPTLNMPTQVVQPGLTTNLTWNATGQLTQVTETDTTTQTVPFSTNGRTRTWTYAYNITGGLLKSVDGPLAGTGDKVSYGYSVKGFIKTITDEVGHVTTVTAWNGRGQPTSVTGMNGVITTYGYDPMGRLLSIIVNPGSSQTVWSMTYTAAGDILTVTEPAGTTYTMSWDSARRLKKITNNLGETLTLNRDVMNDNTAYVIKAADGTTSTYRMTNTFDELGRLITRVGGQSRTWQFAYDTTDLLKKVTDPRTNILSYGYDAVSRLVTETERDGGVVSHAYNAKSEEITYTDPRSKPTTYVRNGFGDVIQEVSRDRGTTVYDYDARGLMISRTDGRGIQTTYAYDNAGRLTNTSYPASSGLNVTYTYDGAGAGANGTGHLTHVVDAAGTTDYFYDAVGRVTGENRTFGSTTYSVAYTYDSAGSGRLIYETLPSGIILNFGYDSLGRVTSVAKGTSFSGPFTTIASGMTYLPFGGGLTGMNFANGLIMTKGIDLEGMPSSLVLAPSSGSALISHAYSVGDGLNLTKIDNSAVDATTTQNFTYDSVQRLLTGTGAYGSRTWTYDKVGNRLSEAATVSGTTTNSTYTYPSTTNRITNITQGGATTRAFTYDLAGGTTQDLRGSTAYNYTISGAGRIGQLSIGSTVTANYTYDGLDRLSVRQTLNMTPAGTTQYLYDVWNHVVAETNGLGTVVKQYVWVGDLPVAVLDGTSSPTNPTLLYVHADHLNRPEMMTNASGAVVWKASYEPFGAVASITGSATLNARFPGQWFQLEAGLHYNWHRSYDPTLGRYTTPDPFGDFLTLSVSASPERTERLPSLEEYQIHGGGDAFTSANIPVGTEYKLAPHNGEGLYTYAKMNPVTRIDNDGLGGIKGIPDSGYCKIMKNFCIQECAMTDLPGPKCDQGNRFFICQNACMRRAGCEGY